jgi:protein arginine N-methyltransferase 2
VRQTLLLNALAERAEEQAGEAGEEEEEEEAKAAGSDAQDGSGDADGSVAQTGGDADTVMTLTAPANELANSNLAFLSSPLRFFTDEKGKERCLDQDDNMVMAGWETNIMRRSADALCKDFPPRYEVHDEDGERRTEGFRVLNIGYGLGIVDDFFQEYKPARHVIVEPHPDAINYFKSKAISQAEGVELIPKRWEDALLDPELGEFDVVYADPFAQDYRDLKKLFDLLPNVLNGRKARFSFFHGLAGTNRFL